MLGGIRWTEASGLAGLCAAIGIVAVTGACSQSDVLAPVGAVPDTVVVTQASSAAEEIEAITALTLVEGETADLVATAYDALGFTVAGVVFDWLSTVPGVATVSVGGVVEALSAGTTEVIASTGEVSGRVAVTVTAAPAFPH